MTGVGCIQRVHDAPANHRQVELADEFGATPVERVLEDRESDVKAPQVKSRRQRRDALVARSDTAGSAAAAAASDPNR